MIANKGNFRSYCRWFLDEERKLLAYFAMIYGEPPATIPELPIWKGLHKDDKEWYIKNIHPYRMKFEFYLNEKNQGINLMKYFI